jgi:hypothetical protein
MPFKKGDKRINRQGRPKGSENKTAKEIREAYTKLISENLNNMSKWLRKIGKDDPVKAMDILIKLSEYTVPKLTRAEQPEGTTLEELLLMPAEKREKRILEIKEQLKKIS